MTGAGASRGGIVNLGSAFIGGFPGERSGGDCALVS